MEEVRHFKCVGWCVARINFEDDVEAQEEFWNLLALTGGDRDRALGRLLRFFRLAQSAYGHNKPMTLDDLTSKGFDDMIQSGWAKEDAGGYHALGAAKHFAWYRQRCEAGHERAKSDRDDRGRFVSSGTPADSSGAPAVDQRDSVPCQPLTLSPSLSLSLSKKEKNINTGAIAPVPNLSLPVPKKSKFSDETKNKMRAFIATYASGYREKYGAPPEGIRDRALVGKLGYWIESVSEERACQLAQVYLQIDHKWVNDSCHDLWQFFRHLNRIGNALATGQDPGGIDWKKVFGAA